MLPSHPHGDASGQYFQFCKYSRWVLERCWGLAVPLCCGSLVLSSAWQHQSSAWQHQSSLCSPPVPAVLSPNPDCTPGLGLGGFVSRVCLGSRRSEGKLSRFLLSSLCFPVPASPGLWERGKHGELLGQPLGFAVIRNKTSCSPFSVPVPPGEELVPNFPRGWHLPWMLGRAESGPREGVCVSGWK